MAKIFNINRFNDTLDQFGQVIRASCITGKQINLSNGVVLTLAADVRKCKRRVMNQQIEFVTRFDTIYQIDQILGKIAETEARCACSAKGGVSCQEKHGNKIRKNLNNGTPWNKGRKLHYDVWNKDLTKFDDHRLAKLSEIRKGAGNPMFGVVHSDEYKEQQSKRMKQLILEGKFTPNSNNINTHWDAEFDNKKYRSSWEAVYQAHHINAEHETLRIEYHIDGRTHIYIVDFVDHIRKVAIEVKPKELLTTRNNVAKITALQLWCNQHDYQMIIADKDYLVALGMPSLELFDQKTIKKVKQLYEVN